MRAGAEAAGFASEQLPYTQAPDLPMRFAFAGKTVSHFVPAMARFSPQARTRDGLFPHQEKQAEPLALIFPDPRPAC